MTDLQNIMTMLGTANITYEQLKAEDVQYYSKDFPEPAASGIQISNSDSPRRIGYTGFVSVWLFDQQGKLLAVGHYE
jgi:hypothetical protein